MICPNCKNEIGNVKFCPYCGGAVQPRPAQPQQAQQPPVQPPVQQPAEPVFDEGSGETELLTEPVYNGPAFSGPQFAPQPQMNQPAPQKAKKAKKANGPKKKHRGLKAFVIVIAVLLAAAVAAAAIVPPVLTKQDNPFAQKLKDVDKKSDEYYMLEVLSAVHNTLFASLGFTAKVSEDGDTLATMKVKFGKDIASSQFYLNADDDIYAALKDKEFTFTDGYGKLTVNAEKLTKNSKDLKEFLNEGAENIRNRSKQYKGEPYEESMKIIADTLEEAANSVDTSVLALIENWHLNVNALSEVFRYAAVFFANSQFGGQTYIYSLRDFNYWYDQLASFIASGANGAFKVSKSGSTYKIKVNLKDLMLALTDYIDKNAELRRLATDELVDEVVAEMRDEFRYWSNEQLTLSVKLAHQLTMAYVSEIKISNDYADVKLTVSKINTTSVSKDDVSKVTRAAKNAQENVKINSFDDLNDLF